MDGAAGKWRTTLIILSDFSATQRGERVINKVLHRDVPPRGPNPYLYIYRYRPNRLPVHVPRIKTLQPLSTQKNGNTY